MSFKDGLEELTLEDLYQLMHTMARDWDYKPLDYPSLTSHFSNALCFD